MPPILAYLAPFATLLGFAGLATQKVLRKRSSGRGLTEQPTKWRNLLLVCGVLGIVGQFATVYLSNQSLNEQDRKLSTVNTQLMSLRGEVDSLQARNSSLRDLQDTLVARNTELLGQTSRLTELGLEQLEALATESETAQRQRGDMIFGLGNRENDLAESLRNLTRAIGEVLETHSSMRMQYEIQRNGDSVCRSFVTAGADSIARQIGCS